MSPETTALAAQLWLCATGTLGRLLFGLAIGVALGSLLGATMASRRWLDQLLGSLVHPLRQIPLFGWIALLGLWAGFGNRSKIVFAALAVAYVMVVAVRRVLLSVPVTLREAAVVYRLGLFARLRWLLLPAILPGFLGGLRIALAAAWGATVGAEILMGGAAPGLGGFIWGQRELGRTDLVLLGTLLIGCCCLLTDIALRYCERGAQRRLVPGD